MAAAHQALALQQLWRAAAPKHGPLCTRTRPQPSHPCPGASHHRRPVSFGWRARAPQNPLRTRTRPLRKQWRGRVALCVTECVRPQRRRRRRAASQHDTALVIPPLSARHAHSLRDSATVTRAWDIAALSRSPRAGGSIATDFPPRWAGKPIRETQHPTISRDQCRAGPGGVPSIFHPRLVCSCRKSVTSCLTSGAHAAAEITARRARTYVGQYQNPKPTGHTGHVSREQCFSCHCVSASVESSHAPSNYGRG